MHTHAQSLSWLDGALLRHPCTPSTQVGEMFHKHQCPRCDTQWAHLDALPRLGLSREEFDEAHSCPHCGTRQYDKVRDASEERKYIAEMFGFR